MASSGFGARFGPKRIDVTHSSWAYQPPPEDPPEFVHGEEVRGTTAFDGSEYFHYVASHLPLRGNIFGISRKIHQKFANFLVAPSRPRNCGDQLPAPLFFISDFFRKVQKVRQFILGFKGEILILAKMELPFRFLEPPRPDGAKNRISRGSKTRLLKFPHYLFDFSLGLSPRTFLPIKKPLFFFTDFFGQNIFCPESYFFSVFSTGS